MTKSILKKDAVKQFNWYIHHVCTNVEKALKYAQGVYDHAYECGWITEQEHKKLCLTLPYETYLK